MIATKQRWILIPALHRKPDSPPILRGFFPWRKPLDTQSSGFSAFDATASESSKTVTKMIAFSTELITRRCLDLSLNLHRYVATVNFIHGTRFANLVAHDTKSSAERSLNMQVLPILFDRRTAKFHRGGWNGATVGSRITFGGGGLEVLVGDWDGSGIDRPIAYDRATATYHRGDWNGATIGPPVMFGDGGNDMKVLVGDWDGSGIDKPILYDKRTARYHRGDWNGATVGAPVMFGGGSMEVLVGDWNGTSIDRPIAYDRATATYHRGDWNGATIGPPVMFGDGGNNMKVLVGDWDGSGIDKPILYDKRTARYHRGDWNGATVGAPVMFGDGSMEVLVGDWLTSTFTFDSDISVTNRNLLIARHRFAISQIFSCNKNLSVDEKNALLSAYQKNIRHSTETRPNVLGAAIVGGSRVWINFGVLFPKGATETSQTLIHEMMHIAGFTHPKRKTAPPGGCDVIPELYDCPHDGGEYYGSAPLRAELCIAGGQSLTSCVANDGRCEIVH